MTGRLILLIFIAALMNSLAQFSIKVMSSRGLVDGSNLGSFFFTLVRQPLIWVAGFLYLGSLLLSVKIFETGNVSLVVPVFTAFLFISVVLLSSIALREPFDFAKGVGFSLIFFGVALLALR